MELTRRRFVGAAAGGLAVLGAGSLVRSNQVHAVRTAPPRPHARPAGLRVALATDMHAPQAWMDAGALARMVGGFDADLLVVGGDAINRRGDEGLVGAYGALPARAGKFATLGNWEYQGACDVATLRREYERAGVRLLVNEEAVVDVRGERVRIVGLDDFLRGRPRLDLLDRAALRTDRTIVVSHCPVLFDDVARVARSPHLVLAGHTHGGQITPFGHVFLVPPGSGPFVRGWYRAPRGHLLYVSRGLGNATVPFRVGASPEISLLSV